MYLRGKRALVPALLVLLVLPAFVYTAKYGIAYVAGPELYPGDRLEERDCRECGGAGEHPPLAGDHSHLGDRCPFCRGKGRVRVIVPGPERPVSLWATVVDLERAGPQARMGAAPPNLRSGAAARLLGRKSGVIPGSIAGARVRFVPASGPPIDATTDPSGRFRRRLRPGTYRVEARADGFEAVTAEIEVPALSEPLWLEKATLVREPRSEAEARSLHGLSLVAGLERRGEEGGFVRIAPGS